MSYFPTPRVARPRVRPRSTQFGAFRPRALVGRPRRRRAAGPSLRRRRHRTPNPRRLCFRGQAPGPPPPRNAPRPLRSQSTGHRGSLPFCSPGSARTTRVHWFMRETNFRDIGPKGQRPSRFRSGFPSPVSRLPGSLSPRSARPGPRPSRPGSLPPSPSLSGSLRATRRGGPPAPDLISTLVPLHAPSARAPWTRAPPPRVVVSDPPCGSPAYHKSPGENRRTTRCPGTILPTPPSVICLNSSLRAPLRPERWKDRECDGERGGGRRCAEK